MGLPEDLSKYNEVSIKIEEFKPRPGNQAKLAVSIGYGKPGTITDKIKVTNTFTLCESEQFNPINSIVPNNNINNLSETARVMARFVIFLLKCPDAYVYEENIDQEIRRCQALKLLSYCCKRNHLWLKL